MGEIINFHFSQTDPEVIKFTTDSNRFRSLRAFQEWENKGDRFVYTLTDFGNNLHGIIWLARAAIPLESVDDTAIPLAHPYTFAIRIYGDTRGKGLALPFMRDTISYFSRDKLPEGALGIWLRVNSDNDVAKRMYAKYGFKDVTKPEVEKYSYMILDL